MSSSSLPQTSDMEAFVACVKGGSFSAAARQLGLPRQTITRRVQRLEDCLGIDLLHRSTQDLVLTQAGHALFEQAELTLRHLGTLVQHVNETAVALRGTLKITTMPLDWGPLREMLLEFCACFPNIQIEMLTTTRYVDLQQEGFDMAIRGGTRISADLNARALGRVHHLVMASPAYLREYGTPRGLKDLSMHRFIASYDDCGIPETSWPLKDVGQISFKPTLCTNDLILRRDAAIRGTGLAILPDLTVAQALRDGQLVRVLPDLIGREATFAIVYRKTAHMKPAVRSFIDFAVRWVQTKTDWLDSANGQLGEHASTSDPLPMHV